MAYALACHCYDDSRRKFICRALSSSKTAPYKMNSILFWVDYRNYSSINSHILYISGLTVKAKADNSLKSY